MSQFVWDREQPPGGGQPPNSGNFTSSPYGNPQMGSYGGTQSGGGGGSGLTTDPNTGLMSWFGGGGGGQAHGLSPTMSNYYSGFSSPNDLWSAGSPTGHRGQEWNFNPYSGQGQWVNSTEGLQMGGTRGTGQGNAAIWIDPVSGMRSVDMSRLNSMFDMGGGGEGYQSFDPSEFSGNQITPPGAYGGADWSTPDRVNVEQVIESYRPTMEAEIGQGFAEAGNRLGQSGFAMSTPYASALGDVERLARAQMNQRTLEYGYNAAESDAARQMQAMMGENAQTFGAWQQGGNWDMGAQGQNAQNAFNQWMAENQWGFQDNQGQNQWNQQQQMQQQQMLAALLGGLL